MEKNTYEIGLVMAGAVSAGAYSGGVLDFLLEAMREWEAYRLEHTDQGCPLHGVKFGAVAGTSAGGMTAAMGVSAMIDAKYKPASGFPDVKPVEGTNVFYESWVASVDIDKLTKTEDFSRGNAPVSLLDCSVLEKVADAGFSRDRSGTFERYCGP